MHERGSRLADLNRELAGATASAAAAAGRRRRAAPAAAPDTSSFTPAAAANGAAAAAAPQHHHAVAARTRGYADELPSPPPPPPQHRIPGTKALVVGVEYRGQRRSVENGCANARRCSALLRAFGFRGEILELLEDSGDAGTQPTLTNMLRAINWLTENVRDGDVLYVFYVGLGGYANKLTKIHALAPLDYIHAGLLSEESISDLLRATGAEASFRVNIVCDSGFGGTILEGASKVWCEDGGLGTSTQSDPVAAARALAAGGSSPHRRRRRGGSRGGAGGDDDGCVVVVLSGARDEQSFEHQIGQPGMLMPAFLEATQALSGVEFDDPLSAAMAMESAEEQHLRLNPPVPRPFSHCDLLQEIRAELRDRRRCSLVPQVSSSSAGFRFDDDVWDVIEDRLPAALGARSPPNRPGGSSSPARRRHHHTHRHHDSSWQDAAAAAAAATSFDASPPPRNSSSPVDAHRRGGPSFSPPPLPHEGGGGYGGGGHPFHEAAGMGWAPGASALPTPPDHVLRAQMQRERELLEREIERTVHAKQARAEEEARDAENAALVAALEAAGRGGASRARSGSRGRGGSGGGGGTGGKRRKKKRVEEEEDGFSVKAPKDCRIHIDYEPTTAASAAAPAGGEDKDEAEKRKRAKARRKGDGGGGGEGGTRGGGTSPLLQRPASDLLKDFSVENESLENRSHDIPAIDGFGLEQTTPVPTPDQPPADAARRPMKRVSITSPPNPALGGSDSDSDRVPRPPPDARLAAMTLAEASPSHTTSEGCSSEEHESSGGEGSSVSEEGSDNEEVGWSDDAAGNVPVPAAAVGRRKRGGSGGGGAGYDSVDVTGRGVLTLDATAAAAARRREATTAPIERVELTGGAHDRNAQQHLRRVRQREREIARVNLERYKAKQREEAKVRAAQARIEREVQEQEGHERYVERLTRHAERVSEMAKTRGGGGGPGSAGGDRTPSKADAGAVVAVPATSAAAGRRHASPHSRSVMKKVTKQAKEITRMQSDTVNLLDLHMIQRRALEMQLEALQEVSSVSQVSEYGGEKRSSTPAEAMTSYVQVRRVTARSPHTHTHTHTYRRSPTSSARTPCVFSSATTSRPQATTTTALRTSPTCATGTAKGSVCPRTAAAPARRRTAERKRRRPRWSCTGPERTRRSRRAQGVCTSCRSTSWSRCR